MQALRSLSVAVLLAGLGPTVLPAALETWSNLDGGKMQAEFLGRKEDFVSFKKDDGSCRLFPYAKLSETDRARVDVHTTPAPATAVATPPVATDDPAAPAKEVGTVSSSLAGKLVFVKGRKLTAVPHKQLNGTRFIVVYHSAHWCPSCRGFTPELVAAYKQIKAAHPEFELVFVSRDETEPAMQGYRTEYGMEWPALCFDQTKTAWAARQPGSERGIPNLDLMDTYGKELSHS